MPYFRVSCLGMGPTLRILALAMPLGAILGCGGETDVGEELKVDCVGKCDGFDTIRSLLRDPSELSLRDLIDIGAALATDEVNDFLDELDYAEIELDRTTTYDEAEVATLVSGLTARFGAHELSTAVGQLRLDHLQGSSDEVYAESAFTIGPHLGELVGPLNFDVPSFGGDEDGTVRLGFKAGADIETRLVTAHRHPNDSFFRAPLAAIKDLPRGFILPRSLEDIRRMKPGELIAKHGEGQLGLNLGVGVPLLLAEPISFLTYELVFSAALRTRLEGDLDIQLIKMAGDEVVIDVGIERARVRQAEVALEDKWGAQGLLELEVALGPVEVDLGRIAERALESVLDSQLDLFEVTASRTKNDMRMSVVRLRFDLAETDPTLAERAISQALLGDVRLAQALANRREPGVAVDFDLLRAGVSTTSYAGAEIFGLGVYRRAMSETGTIVEQTPAGTRAFAFDTLHRDVGWFFTSHGYSRTALAGIEFSVDGRPTSEANLVVQVAEGDSHMERDKLVDHLDGLIVSLAGPEAMRAIEEPANELERFVEEECKGFAVFNPCPLTTFEAPTAVGLRARAEDNLEQALGYVDPALWQMLREVVKMRLLAQSVYEQKAAFTGPGVSLVTDYRLDDRALTAILNDSAGQRVKESVLALLQQTEISRMDTEMSGARAEIENEAWEQLESVGEAVDAHAYAYQRALAAEYATIERVGNVGARGLEVRFTVNRRNTPIYEEAIAQSLASRRAQIAAATFDSLRELADDLGPHAEQVVAYGLLGATPSESVEVRLNLEIDLEDTWAFWREPYRNAGYPEALDVFATGSSVNPINGGFFNVDQLIAYPR